MEARFRGDMTSSLTAGGSTDTPTMASGSNGSARNRGMSAGDWEPTVVYLLVLTIAEIAFYGFMRRVFRHAHGG